MHIVAIILKEYHYYRIEVVGKFTENNFKYHAYINIYHIIYQ